MKMKYLVPVLFLIFTTSSLFSQEREIKKLTHEKRHKVANKLVNTGSYYNAVDQLKELVKEHPDNKTYAMRLADAYFLSRDYRNSEKCYEKIVQLDGKKISLAMYKYAESLKYNAKYAEARDAFKIFSMSKYRENQGEKYKLFAKNEIASCEWALKNLDKENDINITHLGDHVNSKYSEFAPCLMNDSILIFSSIQSDSVITVTPDEPHPFHVKLLASPKSDTLWGPHSELSSVVNSAYMNNANGTFSTDKKKFYFTRCLPNEKNEMVCEIFVSEIKDGVFQKPSKLNKEINKKGFTSTQPFIGTAKVGKSVYEVLYFSSNKPGGKGGLDLYYSLINKDGSTQAPINLGSNVNTIRDEITPYCDKKGTLYFSSNYHFGFGGFDVFKTTGSLNKWEKPVNILKPSNTRVDDTYFGINDESNEGFLVSNRPEGYHLTSETCCDDIYSIKLKNPFLIKLYAYNQGDKRPLTDVKFSIYSRKAEEKTGVDSNVSEGMEQKKDSLLAYLKRNSSKFETNTVTNFIEMGRFNELEDINNLYDAEVNKEYVVLAVYKGDTVLFSFTTEKIKHKVDKFSSIDSLTAYEVLNARLLDLIKAKVYFGSDSVPSVIPSSEIALESSQKKEVVEDEKVFTVTKMMDDLKQQKKIGLKVILNYDFDDANFIEKHSGSLDSLVAMMKSYPEIKINITAHTDSKGSDKYNQVLSQKRAKSIVDYMSKKGIDKKRMASQGRGESEPIVPNTNPDGTDSPENRWLNRRAEITIVE